MGTCIHELEPSTCSFCLGTVSELPKPVRPKNYRSLMAKPTAPKDPDVLVAERVAAGELCGFCRTEMAPIGCHCSRRKAYELNQAATQDWVELCVEDALLDPKRDGAALAFGTHARLARRAAVPTDESEAERRHITALLELVPTWRQPRRVHPDHLPV